MKTEVPQRRRRKKPQINSAASKATSVNDDMLLTVDGFSNLGKILRNYILKKIWILYVGFRMTLRKRNLK